MYAESFLSLSEAVIESYSCRSRGNSFRFIELDANIPFFKKTADLHNKSFILIKIFDSSLYLNMVEKVSITSVPV